MPKFRMKQARPPQCMLLTTASAVRAGVGDVLAEATRLGFGDPVAISAETGERSNFLITSCHHPVMPTSFPRDSAEAASIGELCAGASSHSA